jgi:hypothetical protein
VALSLETNWTCDVQGGLQDLRLRVRVKSPTTATRAFRVSGVTVEGIPELDLFERISGDLKEGYLVAGGEAVFEAHGWSEPGQHNWVLKVPGLEGATQPVKVQIRCPAPSEKE